MRVHATLLMSERNACVVGPGREVFRTGAAGSFGNLFSHTEVANDLFYYLVVLINARLSDVRIVLDFVLSR